MATAMTIDAVAGAPDRAGRQAWTTFTLIFLLMVMDYIDRQVIVSMFPSLKAEFGWTDTQLGGLVSIVALTVALGALPVAMFVDRWSRTKGILVMGTIWSVATLTCGFAKGYSHFFLARLCVGAGEAGYGPAGSALLAHRFPARMHGFIMAAFQAAGGIGSILGVLLGGYIAAHWGWRAAFGVVGIPGLILALAFWFVPDYKTVSLRREAATEPAGNFLVATFREFRAAPTALLVSIGGAMQLGLVAIMITWLPSFFARVHGVEQQQAGAMTALVILAYSVGAMVWGRVIDRAGLRGPEQRLTMMAVISLASGAVVGCAFGLMPVGPLQTAGIIFGGFLMSCTLGTVVAITLEVIHPAFRATAAAFTALVGNLGMALGPFALGVLSDAYGLEGALVATPVFTVLAALLFLLARPIYRADRKRAEAAQ